MRGAWGSIRGVLEKLFAVFGVVLRFVLNALRYVLGFGGIAFGALGMAALISAYSVGLFSDVSRLPLEVRSAIDIVIAEPVGLLFLAAVFVLAFIPLLLLIMLGVGLLKKQNVLNVTEAVTLGVVWIVALTVAITAGWTQGQKVYQEVEENSEYFEYIDEDLDIVVDEHGIRIINF